MRRLLLPALFAVSCLLSPITSATAAHSVNKIAAIVNGDPILQSKINKRVKEMQLQAKITHMAPMPESNLRELITNQMIMETLQLQMAKRHHITTTTAQLNKAIATVAKNNHLTLAELKSKITSEGGSFATFKKRIQDQLIIMALQQKAVSSTGANFKITDADVRDYRKKHRLASTKYLYQVGDIYVSAPDNPTPEQAKNLQRRAEGIAKQIKDGTNFHKLAQLESSSDSPKSSHVLSWRPKDEIPTAFVKALPSFTVGASAGPIRTDNGWHIIKILNRKTDAKTMSDQNIRQLLFREKYNAALKKWLKELRDTSDVHVIH